MRDCNTDEHMSGKLTSVLDAFSAKLSQDSFIKTLVSLLFALYLHRIAPPTPKYIDVLFKDQYFKLCILALILVIVNVKPLLALGVSFTFLAGMNFINNMPVWEFLDEVEEVEVEDTPGVIVAPTSDLAEIQASTKLNTPIVAESEKKDGKVIVIQPTVTNGVLTTPNVLIAPAVVKDGNGDVSIVQPSVTMVTPQPKEITQAPQPKEITQAPQSSCYPLRKYDMSKVSGYITDGFEYGVYKN